jgi:hypothetical protein
MVNKTIFLRAIGVLIVAQKIRKAEVKAGTDNIDRDKIKWLKKLI